MKKAAPRRCLPCVLPLSEIAAVEVENERVQLLFQVDSMILDQLLDTCFLIRKALCVMQPVLNVEPGKRLDLRTQISDHCLAFHIFPSVL